MTFKAEYGLKIKLQFALLMTGAVVTLGAFIFDENYLALIVSLPLILATFVCGMQLVATAYTLDGDFLIAKSGLSKVEISYKDITLITDKNHTPADGYVPLATSEHKLYVIYMQGGKAYRLELSPYDRVGFVEALSKKL